MTTDPNKATGEKAPRPYWIPDNVDFESLPERLKTPISAIVNPAYEELVMRAQPGIDQSTGITIVYLLWLEILDQIELGEVDIHGRSGPTRLLRATSKVAWRRFARRNPVVGGTAEGHILARTGVDVIVAANVIAERQELQWLTERVEFRASQVAEKMIAIIAAKQSVVAAGAYEQVVSGTTDNGIFTAVTHYLAIALESSLTRRASSRS